MTSEPAAKWCLHSTERQCPISKTGCLADEECPEECPFSIILENVSVGIILVDLTQKRVLFQNHYATELLKIGSHPRDFEALVSLLLPKWPESPGAVNCGAPSTIHYGSRLLGFTAYHISGRYCWIFVRDITNHQRLESVAEAVNMADNIGFIFSGIRHELGNPINSAKLTLSVLRDNLEHYTRDRVLAYVDRSLAEISRVEYLLASLKSFSMFERPDLKQVDLVRFLRQFLHLIAADFEKKRVRIKTQLPPGSVWIDVDPRALQQVMLNILTNAGDAVGDRETPEIEIALGKSDGNCVIKITDNGCGISESEQKNLFKPFFTSKPKGTGLGLVIARKMLATMNGQIQIESEEGIGTTATLIFPESEHEND